MVKVIFDGKQPGGSSAQVWDGSDGTFFVFATSKDDTVICEEEFRSFPRAMIRAIDILKGVNHESAV